MELQLGLALPTPLITLEMLDLNSYGCEHREALGSNALSWPLLKLGPSVIDINNSSSSSSCGGGKSPYFDEAALLFGERRIVPETLPLLHWSNQPNDEEFDHNSSSIFKKEYDGEGLLGWPPVKTSRKTQGHQISDGVADNNHTVAAAAAAVDNGRGGASKSTYVKVKMEGVAIARKVDVSVHHSFEALTSTVMRMFSIPDEYRESFKLTYQDREGDWLLAEDVPWRTFVRSLKCLKLIRCRGYVSS